MVVIEFLKSE